MKKLVVTLLAAALFVGCSPDARESATDGLKNLAEIRSGEIALDVSISPQGEEEATGFALEGVFSLPEGSGELPEADLAYTQRANGEAAEGRFVSDGETIFVEVDGDRTELPPDQVESFRVAGTESGESIFQSLDATTWFDEPETEGSGEEVTITGDLDVVAALNDIFEVARSFGGAMEPIEGDEAEIVRDSVRDATAEITTGADGLLRHATVTIDFGVADPELGEVLGSFAGATFSLDLRLENVNEAVDVK